MHPNSLLTIIASVFHTDMVAIFTTDGTDFAVLVWNCRDRRHVIYQGAMLGCTITTRLYVQKSQEGILPEGTVHDRL